MEKEGKIQFALKKSEKSDSEEKRQEKYEYSFDEGAEEVVKRITKLLENQKIAAVAFSSTHRNVGKTVLANKIMSELVNKENIYAACFHGLNDITKNEIREIQEICARYAKEKIAIIIDQLELGGAVSVKNHKKIVDFHNQIAAETFDGTGWDIKKIDLWVGIYRPDRPFNKEINGNPVKPIADIIIRNEFAKDK